METRTDYCQLNIGLRNGEQFTLRLDEAAQNQVLPAVSRATPNLKTVVHEALKKGA